jgi:hypothetical protein
LKNEANRGLPNLRGLDDSNRVMHDMHSVWIYDRMRLMGITNIHILTDPEAKPNPVIQVKRRKETVSRHVVVNKQGTKKWVFGWDQPLMSFYLQVHDLTLPADEQITDWLGADRQSIMYEVEDLIRAAKDHGLAIDSSYRPVLYKEKDDGV